MNDLTQDLREYREHLESELAFMAKATAGPWSVNKDRNWETYSVEADDTVCDLYYMSEETHGRHPFYEGNEEQNATAITAARNGYEQSLRAQLRMLDALEIIRCDLSAVRQEWIDKQSEFTQMVFANMKQQSDETLRDIIAARKGGRA